MIAVREATMSIRPIQFSSPNLSRDSLKITSHHSNHLFQQSHIPDSLGNLQSV